MLDRPFVLGPVPGDAARPAGRQPWSTRRDPHHPRHPSGHRHLPRGPSDSRPARSGAGDRTHLGLPWPDHPRHDRGHPAGHTPTHPGYGRRAAAASAGGRYRPHPCRPGAPPRSLCAEHRFSGGTNSTPTSSAASCPTWVERLGIQLRGEQQVCRSLTLTVRYADHSTTTRNCALPEPTAHSPQLRPCRLRVVRHPRPTASQGPRHHPAGGWSVRRELGHPTARLRYQRRQDTPDRGRSRQSSGPLRAQCDATYQHSRTDLTLLGLRQHRT